MAPTPPTEPDPRTANDDEDAANQGRSTQAPAEGDDATAPRQLDGKLGADVQ